MTTEHFFNLFLEELKNNEEMQGYYKFLQNKESFEFRKHYFLKRLNYINDTINKKGGIQKIVDIGCGYGTTAIFLALSGHIVDGLTLESYFAQIVKRKTYWSQFGDLANLNIKYADLFDRSIPEQSYDSIIIQDTLHHLEPVSDALDIVKSILKDDGQIIIIEENGQNIVSRTRLYLLRGNQRIKEMHDEKLNKTYLIGNENIRSLTNWSKLFTQAGLMIDNSSTEFIRYYLPFVYTLFSADSLHRHELRISKKSHVRRNYLFFGLNFTARKR